MPLPREKQLELENQIYQALLEEQLYINKVRVGWHYLNIREKAAHEQNLKAVKIIDSYVNMYDNLYNEDVPYKPFEGISIDA